MNVREVLSREHRSFRLTLDALEREADQHESRAKSALADSLRLLLPALDRHEELEDLIFEFASMEDGGEALDAVAAQHRGIAELREEILEVLERVDACSFDRLRGLALFLAQSLRVHLNTEESRLWESFRDLLDRPCDAVLAERLRRRARVLERELRRGRAAIAASFR
jgi:hemerythrin-like domain-containing protein